MNTLFVALLHSLHSVRKKEQPLQVASENANKKHDIASGNHIVLPKIDTLLNVVSKNRAKVSP